VEIGLHDEIRNLFKKVEYYGDKLMLPFRIVESCSLILQLFGIIVPYLLSYVRKLLLPYLQYLILFCL
jgi:hypothetical protein